MPDVTEYCPVCEKAGEKSPLSLCQINFKTAVYICKKPNCTYPEEHNWKYVSRDILAVNEADLGDSSDDSDIENFNNVSSGDLSALNDLDALLKSSLENDEHSEKVIQELLADKDQANYDSETDKSSTTDLDQIGKEINRSKAKKNPRETQRMFNNLGNKLETELGYSVKISKNKDDSYDIKNMPIIFAESEEGAKLLNETKNRTTSAVSDNKIDKNNGVVTKCLNTTAVPSVNKLIDKIEPEIVADNKEIIGCKKIIKVNKMPAKLLPIKIGKDQKLYILDGKSDKKLLKPLKIVSFNNGASIISNKVMEKKQSVEAVKEKNPRCRGLFDLSTIQRISRISVPKPGDEVQVSDTKKEEETNKVLVSNTGQILSKTSKKEEVPPKSVDVCLKLMKKAKMEKEAVPLKALDSSSTHNKDQEAGREILPKRSDVSSKVNENEKFEKVDAPAIPIDIAPKSTENDETLFDFNSFLDMESTSNLESVTEIDDWLKSLL